MSPAGRNTSVAPDPIAPLSASIVINRPYWFAGVTVWVAGNLLGRQHWVYREGFAPLSIFLLSSIIAVRDSLFCRGLPPNDSGSLLNGDERRYLLTSC
jgi:hypothetical protein